MGNGRGTKLSGNTDFPGDLEALFKREHGLILAGLLRHNGADFFRAEDALSEAFASALEKWPREGLPERPGAWLNQVARRRLVDGLRRRAFEEPLGSKSGAEDLFDTIPQKEESPMHRWDLEPPEDDDRIQLLFTCCHPALDGEAQVALMLTALCGLKPAEVARAFLLRPSTLAQRLVRAKRKIKQAGVPFGLTGASQVHDRLESVLQAIYLTFNEGYAATAGDDLVRHELASEAIELARQVSQCLPKEAEARGLYALLVLQHARRLARVSEAGHLVVLQDQDRSLWDRTAIQHGIAELDMALKAGPAGPYRVQAAIAALHDEALTAADTDWAQIVLLYDRLLDMQPSPVIALNRCVAVSMHQGPLQALEALESIPGVGALESYLYLHSTKADFLRRLGRVDAARAAYLRAVALADNALERRFLTQRLAELDS